MTDSLETIQREATQSLQRSMERRRQQLSKTSTALWMLAGFMLVVVGIALGLLLLGVVRV